MDPAPPQRPKLARPRVETVTEPTNRCPGGRIGLARPLRRHRRCAIRRCYRPERDLASWTRVRGYRHPVTDSPPAVVASRKPEACTLPTAQLPLRLAEFDDLFRADAVRVRRVDACQAEFELRADPAAAGRAAELAARETGCCSFFTFTLTVRTPAGCRPGLGGRNSPEHRSVIPRSPADLGLYVCAAAALAGGIGTLSLAALPAASGGWVYLLSAGLILPLVVAAANRADLAVLLSRRLRGD